jgi:hypothetical protein
MSLCSRIDSYGIVELKSSIFQSHTTSGTEGETPASLVPVGVLRDSELKSWTNPR